MTERMQDKLRAISGLNVGTRVVGDKPFGERMMASSPDLSAAAKAAAKRRYKSEYYLKNKTPKKSRRGTK